MIQEMSFSAMTASADHLQMFFATLIGPAAELKLPFFILTERLAKFLDEAVMGERWTDVIDASRVWYSEDDMENATKPAIWPWIVQARSAKLLEDEEQCLAVAHTLTGFSVMASFVISLPSRRASF